MISIFKGPAFYSEEENSIFKGRKDETKKLFDLVEHSDFCVCYAESGEGKSSLINAGLQPKLREVNYFPIRVVFNEEEFLKLPSDGFDSLVWKKINEALDKARKAEYLKGKYDTIDFQQNTIKDYNPTLAVKDSNIKLSDSLWWRLRTYELRLDFYETLIPVLIFDQFEEVFTRVNDIKWTDAFFKWLEMLYQDHCLVTDENEDVKGSQQEVINLPKKFKVLLSLRSDYVSELDYWAMNQYFIPSLKNNRYCLKPLTKGAAQEVAEQMVNLPTGIERDDIVRQAKTIRTGKWEDISDNSPLPCVSALLLSLLLTGLTEKDVAVETKLDELKDSQNNDTYQIFFDFLLNHIYEKTLKDSGIQLDSSYREWLENALIDSNGKRRRVPKDDKEIRGIPHDVLNKLIQKRILNEIDNCYEISHDALCPIILKSREKRRAEMEFKTTLERQELKRKLLIQRYWTDYFVLFPFFLFFGFVTFFLFNSIMNEISPVLFDASEKDYENGIFILCSPIFHLLGNAAMLAVGFYELSMVTIFRSRKFNVRFIWFASLISILAITLCVWHYLIFVPHHTVFKSFDTDLVSISWWAIYIGLVAISLIITILSITNNPRYNGEKWTDILFCKLLFSMKSARAYIIVLLFLCLYICVIPSYKRTVSSNESVIFLLLIGLITQSLFHNRFTLKTLIKYIGCFAVFYLGLFLYDGEFMSPLGNTFKKWPFNIEVYLLLMFLSFIMLEAFFCKRIVRKTIRRVAVCINVVIVLMGAIMFIGYFPFIQTPMTPAYKNVLKWHYMITINDSCFGAVSICGNTFVPNVFDSIGERSYLFFKIPDKRIFSQNEHDTFFVNQGNSIVGLSNSNSEFPMNVYTEYVLSLDENYFNGKGIHKYAYRAYQEIQKGNLQKLKYGRRMTSEDLSYILKLKDVESKSADSLFNLMKDSMSIIKINTFVSYLETIVQEMNTAFLIEVYKANSSVFTNSQLAYFEFSHFYDIMNLNGTDAIIRVKIDYDGKIVDSLSDKSEKKLADLSSLVKDSINIKDLSARQPGAWFSLWKSSYSEMQLYFSYLYLEDFRNQWSQISAMTDVIDKMLQDVKEHYASVQTHSIQSNNTILRIKNENYSQQLSSAKTWDEKLELAKKMLKSILELEQISNTDKILKSEIKDLLTRADSLGTDIENVKSGRRKYDILLSCCEKRLNEIESLESYGLYRGIFNELKRDFILLLILTNDYKDSHKMTEKITNMEKEDSLLNSRKYGGLLDILGLERKVRSMGTELKNKTGKLLK